MKNNPNPKPKHDGGEDKSTNRHVYVEPGVQIDLVKDLKEKYEAAQADNTAHSNKILFWTKISAALLFIYAALNWWQACSAHDTLKAIKEQFRLDQRPYISVVSFQILDGILPATSKPKERQEFEIGKPLVVTVETKNVGKSPAINSTFHYHILFGEGLNKFKIEPTDKGKRGPTIDPGAVRFMTTVSLIDTYSRESANLNTSDVINWDGSEPLYVFGRISYEDTSGHFYCTPYMVYYFPNNWAYPSDVTVSGVNYLVSDLCPDKA
jgi:hypothetical protein